MADERHFLENVEYDKALKLNGGFVHNYKELLDAVRYMSASNLRDKKSIIVSWIEENYEDEKLVSSINSAKSKKHFESAISTRISQLKKQPRELSNRFIATLAISLIVISTLSFIYADAKIDLVRAQNQVDALQTDVITLESSMKNVLAGYDNVTSLQKSLNEAIETSERLSLQNEDLANLLDVYKAYRTARDIPAPVVRLDDLNISILKDRISILVPDARIALIADTGSMNPVLIENAHTIEIVPSSTSEIKKGDIISYEVDNQIIIHRVLFTSSDNEGWYARTQGDSNMEEDPYKVRFEQIKGLVIGILY